MGHTYSIYVQARRMPAVSGLAEVFIHSTIEVGNLSSILPTQENETVPVCTKQEQSSVSSTDNMHQYQYQALIIIIVVHSS